MVNNKSTYQYITLIKNKGYKYSKDDLNFYFDKEDKKFSITKVGPFFQVFYNENIGSKWILKNKMNSTTQDFNECLRWILQNG